MKKVLLFLIPIALFGQAFRVDPTPVFTTSGVTPIGAYAPVLAVPGATITVCSNSSCSTAATTYTDATGTTTCPANAQVVIAGTTGCTSTANAQGDFGFWLTTGTYYYQIQYPNGSLFGPYPVSVGGSGGGGSGCTPSGTLNALLYQNPVGSCAASPNLVFTAGNVVLAGGFIQASGGFNTTASATNAIQAPNGGAEAQWLTATDSVFWIEENPTGVPLSGVGQARVFASSTTTGGFTAHQLYISINGGAYTQFSGGGGGGGANTALSNLAAVSINSPLLFQGGQSIGSATNPAQNLFLYGAGTYGSAYFEFTGTPTGNRVITMPNRTANMATTSGALTNGDCAQFDGSGNIVDAGGACTTGGGGGTVSSALQYQLGVYPANGTTIAGNANLTFNTSTQLLTVTGTSSIALAVNITGFAEATDGFNAGSCALTTCIQAASGGMNALWLTAQDSVFWVSEAPGGVPLSGAGQARVFLSNATTGGFLANTLYLSTNGGAYAAFSGSGGGSCPGGSTTQVQYNNSGACAGSSNLTYASGNVNLGSGSFLTVGTTAGFDATTCTATNCIQAPNGGVTALAVFASTPALNAINTNGNVNGCAANGAAGGKAFSVNTTNVEVIDCAGEFTGTAIAMFQGSASYVLSFSGGSATANLAAASGQGAAIEASNAAGGFTEIGTNSSSQNFLTLSTPTSNFPVVTITTSGGTVTGQTQSFCWISGMYYPAVSGGTLIHCLDFTSGFLTGYN